MAKREFSAGGVVVKKRSNSLKILLIKDSYGRWSWPKGNIDKNETSQQAALREINEEVGLSKIEILEKLTDIKYFYRLKGDLIFKTVFLFLVKAGGSEKLKVLKSEIEAAEWLSPKSALARVEYKGAKETLSKAIQRFEQLSKKKAHL